jgi:hypothetical protein
MFEVINYTIFKSNPIANILTLTLCQKTITTPFLLYPKEKPLTQTHSPTPLNPPRIFRIKFSFYFWLKLRHIVSEPTANAAIAADYLAVFIDFQMTFWND